MKVRLALFFAFLSSVASASATPPEVVFVGDYLTYYWGSTFAANPNWINQATPGIGRLGGLDSGGTLAAFPSAVNLHPAIIHIMVGINDVLYVDDTSWPDTVPGLLTNLDAMVKEAKAADIKVILGTEPSSLGSSQPWLMQGVDAVIQSYGAANNIPVINYGDALCVCVGSVSGVAYGGDQAGVGVGLLVPTTVPWPANTTLLPSTAGYNLMTQMAQAAVATINVTLKSGWLQNVEQTNPTTTGPVSNVNAVFPGATVQFTPTGFYSDGSEQPILNTNSAGASGIWTSSNPLVMSVNQQGTAWALSAGTATIRYTPPNGVKFSSWVMHISPVTL